MTSFPPPEPHRPARVVPAWPAAPSPSTDRRARRPSGPRLHRFLGVWLALVVLAGGAYASARLLLADERGAETPEAAGEALLGALNDADLLGLIDLLPDGERQLLVDLTGELRDEGERLGVLGGDLELDGVPGVDLQVTDAELHVQELGDGVAWVSVVDGTASVEIDGGRLAGSLGDVVDAVAEANGVDLDLEDVEHEVDLGEEAEGDEELAEERDAEPVYSWGVAVVEQDGRWFPSLAFTLAEAARVDPSQDAGEVPDPPDLDDGVEPDGGRDPVDAVQELVDAAVEGDLESVLEIVDPGELGALQVYAEVLLGDLATGEDADLTVEITDADVRSLGDGVHRVLPTGLVAEVDLGDGVLLVTLDDGCFSVRGESDDDDLDDVDVELCDRDVAAIPGELGEDFDDVEVPDRLTELAEAFEPIELGVITVERDGEHFVSPVRTLFDVVAASFRGLEPEDVAEGGIVFEALTGGLDDDFDSFFDDLAEGIDEQLEDLEDDGPGPGPGPDDDDADDDASDVPVRPATGPSGPDGALLVGDVVASELPAGEVAVFTVIGVAGEGYVGAQALTDADLTITVRDAATGDELDFSDDFVGTDPEAFVVLTEGQVLTVEVAGYAEDDAGPFVVYYEA